MNSAYHKTIRLFPLIMLVLSLMVGAATGQVYQEPFFPPSVPAGSAANEVQLRRFASSAESRGDYETALRYYRQLRELYGETRYKHIYYQGELRCLLGLKRYEEAESMVQTEITKSNALSGELSVQSLVIDLGEVYFAWGKESEAWEQWNRALREWGNNIQVYRNISSSLLRARKVDAAILVLKQGEARLGVQALALDLARAYTVMMDYGNATQYYLEYLKGNESRLSYVERAIYNFPDSDETSEAVINELKKLKDIKGADDILIGYLFSLGRYEEALEYTSKRDEDGNDLLDFAASITAEGRYDLALEAYNLILSKYPNSPHKLRIMAGIAECYDKLGNYEQALVYYKEILHNHPNSHFRETALFRVGWILLEVETLPDSAKLYFEAILESGSPATGEWFQAGLALGKCFVVSSSLEDAIARYSAISNTRQGMPDEIAAQASLMLGRCYLWGGEIDSALIVWDRLSKRFPGTEAANDALGDLLLLKEVRDSSLIGTFAQAWYELEQRKYDRSFLMFRDIIGHQPDMPLAGRSLLFAAEALAKMAGTDSSLMFLDSYIVSHPDYPFKDEVYYQMAELCLTELNDTAKATDYFERLLIETPESPLAPLVRRKLENISLSL